MPSDDDLRACWEAGLRDGAANPIRPPREACEQLVRLLLARERALQEAEAQEVDG